MSIILGIIAVVAALAFTVAAALYIADKVSEELGRCNQSKSEYIMIICMGVGCFCLVFFMLWSWLSLCSA